MNCDSHLLDRIAGTAEKWRRRCNGMPTEGILIDAAGLRAVLASSADVAAGTDGAITWRSNGRRFTAEPVLNESTG
jgi:hypothetical protein